MKYFKKYLLWAGGFFLICTGNFCTHHLAYGKTEFGYNLLTNNQGENVTYNDAEMQAADVLTSDEPEAITWDALKDVTFEIKFNKDYQLDFQYPVFGSTIKRTKGKELFIKGYVIPLDVNQGLYALSRYPYSSCYFCGKSGPESVVSLKFKTKPKKYRLDAVRTMKGTMYLNNTNPMDFIYIFKDAEEYTDPGN